MISSFSNGFPILLCFYYVLSDLGLLIYASHDFLFIMTVKHVYIILNVAILIITIDLTSWPL